MKSPGNVIKSYFFWSYERGSFHYDVMVTLVILFVFVAPHYIDFHDKPVPAIPIHASEVLVREAGSAGNEARFIYEIRVEDLGQVSDDASIRAGLLRVIEPMSGNVTVEQYKPVTDAKGKVVAYDATVLR